MDVRTKLLELSRTTGERYYDPERLLVSGSQRETSWYVVTLLESDRAADREQANRILARLPPGGSGHAMSTLGFIYYHYADRLTAEARANLVEYFRRTVPECGTMFYGFGNVNHPLTAFVGEVFAGEIADEPALAAFGRARLENFLWWINWQHDVDRAMSALSEYNSPTYTAVNILGVHCLAAYGRDAASRQLARQIEETFWMDVALFYHPSVGTLAGPHSRAYQDGCFGSGAFLDSLFWKVSGGRTFLDVDLLDHCHHSCDRIAWSLPAVFDFFVPEQARRIMFEKRFPFEVHANAVSCGWHDGQYVTENGKTRYAESTEDYPGAYQHLSCYMTRNASLGCADGMYVDGGQNNTFLLRWARTQPVARRGDTRTIFCRYLIDDAQYGRTYPVRSLGNRERDGWLHVLEGGRSHILHHRTKAIALFCPKRREWRGHNVLRLGVHITELTPVDAIDLDDRKVTALPVDFGWDQTLYLEDGPMYVAIRPLAPADGGYKTPCRIERIQDHLLLSIYNYDGPEATWDPDRMQRMHNGFVLEFGEKPAFATLDAFKTHMRRGRIAQQVVSYGIREVGYESGGDALFLRYDALREKILTATVNGKTTWPEYLDVTMEGAHDPEFCPRRIW